MLLIMLKMFVQFAAMKFLAVVRRPRRNDPVAQDQQFNKEINNLNNYLLGHCVGFFEVEFMASLFERRKFSFII